MNITNLQSMAAPILAPIAPAILFGNNLHAGMIADGVNPVLANFGAVLGTGGVELSGALACSMAVMAYHRKDYKIMAVSIAASVIYAMFVMVGILQARNSATFAGAVVISLVAYLMQGVWQSYNNKLRTEQAETDLRVKELDAQRKLVNSQIRQAKVSTVGQPVGQVGGQTGGQASKFVADPQLIAAVEAFWLANPHASLRDCAHAVGCSPMTASKYKPAVQP
jgi:hypothetical protein